MKSTMNLQDLPIWRSEEELSEGGFSENMEDMELPQKLLEKHEPWPAYVTYMSQMVMRLIEKARIREHVVRETQRASRSSKPSTITQLKRRKSSNESLLKDALSETMLSLWDTFSVNMCPGKASEPLHRESRENPTADYNKIIFAKKPKMKLCPYDLLQKSKENHTSI